MKTRMPGAGKTYRFDEIFNLLHAVRAIEEQAKDKMSVKMATLLSVYLQSKNTYQKELDAKKKKP